MKKQTLIILCGVILLFAHSSYAEASTATQALKRMDEIITQMQSLRDEFASLLKVVEEETKTSIPEVRGAATQRILGDHIAYGETNDDIKKIQKLLATDSSIYPYGVVSGFYGPKTRDAIRAFQARFALDPVGVVGPATRSLLEAFFAVYPNDEYPADVLRQAVPKAQAVSHESHKSDSFSSQKSSATTDTTQPRFITVTEDNDEFIVHSYNSAGKRNRDLILYPKDYDDLVILIAEKLHTSKEAVRTLVDESDLFPEKKQSSYNEGDATDAINDARRAISKARSAIRDARDDGDNTDDADAYYDDARRAYTRARSYREDERYADAVEKAEDAQDYAKKAIRAL